MYEKGERKKYKLETLCIGKLTLKIGMQQWVKLLSILTYT